MTAHFTLYEFTNQVTQHADGAAGWLLLKDRDPERHPKLCLCKQIHKALSASEVFQNHWKKEVISRQDF